MTPRLLIAGLCLSAGMLAGLLVLAVAVRRIAELIGGG